MKDLQIVEIGKGKVQILANTKAAKKVFVECGAEENDPLEGKQKDLHKLLSWAVSHNLSIDTKLEIIIPELPRIEGKDAMRKALCMPTSVPDSFLPRVLFAIGYSKFKGDSFTGKYKNWSVNDQFEKGKEYPVYNHEGLFVVGKDGKGYKMTPIAWTKTKAY